MSNELSKYTIANHVTPDQCRIELVITENCSFRCTYCYWKNDKNYNFNSENLINQDNFKRVVDFFLAQGKKKNELTFYGGEPTVHPDLFYFIDYAYDRIPGLDIGLLTNLSKPVSYFKKFPRKKVRSVIASLHTETVSDVDDWFEKVAFIRPAEIRLVLTEKNRDLIFNTYEKYRAIYEEEMVIHPLSDYQDVGNLLALEDFAVQIDDDNYSHGDNVEIKLKNGEDFKGDYRQLVNFKGMMCNAGYHVDMKGNVYSCWSAYGANNVVTNIFRDDPKKLSGWTYCSYDFCSCGKRYTKLSIEKYLEWKRENR